MALKSGASWATCTSRAGTRMRRSDNRRLCREIRVLERLDHGLVPRENCTGCLRWMTLSCVSITVTMRFWPARRAGRFVWRLTTSGALRVQGAAYDRGQRHAGVGAAWRRIEMLVPLRRKGGCVAVCRCTGLDLDERTILRFLHVVDVSLVTFPAYPATEASVRHLEERKQEWLREQTAFTPCSTTATQSRKRLVETPHLKIR